MALIDMSAAIPYQCKCVNVMLPDGAMVCFGALEHQWICDAEAML